MLFPFVSLRGADWGCPLVSCEFSVPGDRLGCYKIFAPLARRRARVDSAQATFNSWEWKRESHAEVTANLVAARCLNSCMTRQHGRLYCIIYSQRRKE
jgi:hypothetical protein